jgi:cytochrome c551/c552
MHSVDWNRAICAGLRVLLAGLALFGASAGASDGGDLAVHYGCINCHSSEARAAPSLKRLADRVGRDGDTPQAQQRMLEQFREHAGIHTHQLVSDESALAVLRWLAQGAK